MYLLGNDNIYFRPDPKKQNFKNYLVKQAVFQKNPSIPLTKSSRSFKSGNIGYMVHNQQFKW